MSGRSVGVVVVGGGPAGLATAIATQQAGLETLVVDRQVPRIDKACGEGLMPDGLACLDALGVRLPPATGVPFRGIRYIDAASQAEGRFPGAPGLGLRRTDLHAALVARAKAVGVTLRWQCRVQGLLGEPGRYQGIETHDGPVRARWIVAADGLRSPLRHQAGLAGRAQPRTRQRFGVRRHLALAPWSDCVEVYWADDVEAYVTPVGPNEVGVACLWRGIRGRQGGFDGLLTLFPTLQERLQGAEPRSRDRGWGPLRQRVRSVTRGNLALVGDAAGYLDAITGEGLSLAFHQSRALAEALAAGSMRHYRREHRALGAFANTMTRAVLWLEGRPALRRRALRALADDPALFSRLLAAHARVRPATRAGFIDAPQLAWRMLRAF